MVEGWWQMLEEGWGTRLGRINDRHDTVPALLDAQLPLLLLLRLLRLLSLPLPPWLLLCAVVVAGAVTYA